MNPIFETFGYFDSFTVPFILFGVVVATVGVIAAKFRK